MLSSQKAFVQISVLLFALTVTPKLLVSFSSSAISPVVAQSSSNPSPTFPLPESLPSGTTVKVDGSKSMRVINEALKTSFLEKFPDTEVELTATGTDQALAALLKGEISLAAIGRPLTDPEKAQGLVAVPVSREKIAIIVGSDNPFQENLTFEQFARIFRGEITDWSQVGGSPGAIRFIDHPDYSDTRRSFGTYDIFKKAPFKTGSNAIQVSEDDTAAVVKELGKDGISYAITDQVSDLKDVRIIPMHKTLPDDPRYPYSQPRGYVYRQETTDPGVLSFLAFATSPPGQEIVQDAKDKEKEAVRQAVETATPSAATSPSAPVTDAPDPASTDNANATATATTDQNVPWWLLLLLLIPLGAGLLWWVFKRSGDSSDAPAASPPTSGVTPPVPPETTGEGRTDSGTLSTPVTPGINATDGADSPAILTTRGTSLADATPEVAPETNSITSSDPVVSEPAAISSAASPEMAGAAGALAGMTGIGMAAGVAGVAGVAGRSHKSKITLVAGDNQHLLADWDVPESEREWAKQQGGQQFQLRIYEVTGIDIDSQPANDMQIYDCDEFSQQQQVSVPVGDRDYMAEIGYLTLEGQWLKLALSNSVWVPASVPTLETTESGLSSGATAIATGAIPSAESTATTSRLVLSAGDNQHLLADWDVPESAREWARQQGGQQFQLRIYEVTGIDIDSQPANDMQIYDCDEFSQQQQVSVPVGDRDYMAEIGYLTLEGQWLKLALSNSVWVPASNLTQPNLETEETTLAEAPFPVAELSPIVQREGCKIKHLTVHSRHHCFALDSERMRTLQETAVSKTLEPGIYIVRIKSGAFGYSTDVNQPSQPMVLLWIYGGKVINKKTNVPVPATWSTLNGYHDTLTLEVLETATLCAFFFDTYLDDNDGEVTLSVARLYPNARGIAIGLTE